MFKIKRCLVLFLKILQSFYPEIFISRKNKKELRKINESLYNLKNEEVNFL